MDVFCIGVGDGGVQGFPSLRPFQGSRGSNQDLAALVRAADEAQAEPEALPSSHPPAPVIQRQPLERVSDKHREQSGQTGCGTAVCEAVFAGRVNREGHFMYWDEQKKGLLLQQKWCPPIKPDLRLKPRQGGHNLPGQMPPRKHLPRIERAVQTLCSR